MENTYKNCGKKGVTNNSLHGCCCWVGLVGAGLSAVLTHSSFPMHLGAGPAEELC